MTVSMLDNFMDQGPSWEADVSPSYNDIPHINESEGSLSCLELSPDWSTASPTHIS
jgi:hypothetical protein